MATEIIMPQLGLTMETGTVEQWLKKEGEPVKAGEPIVSITTDKLTNEISAEAEGVLLKIMASEGTDVPVKGLLGYIGQPGEQLSEPTSSPSAATVAETPVLSTDGAAAPAPVAVDKSRKIKISPLARKMAVRMKIDYSALAGTGPGGRIIKRDILSAQESSAGSTAPNPAPATSSRRAAVPAFAMGAVTPFPAKDLERMEGDTVTKLSGMRRVVAQRMFTSALETPPVTQTVKVDVTALMDFRAKINTENECKFSVNDYVLKAAAKALKKHPEVLVSLDGEQVIHRKHINLGMAVALEEGLIVPVIRDADQLGLEELSACARDLATRARENRLSPDEYKGSTFTVSNLGMFGVESFTPIINQPDAAILGVNCIENELVMVEDGTVQKHQVMRISLTFDHRLMDGAVAARFEQNIRDLLQSPVNILL